MSTNAGSSGRGPTSDISPRTTLISLGQLIRPVTAEDSTKSRDPAIIGPRQPRGPSLLTTIVRIFRTVIILPPSPTRLARWRIGPRSPDNLIATTTPARIAGIRLRTAPSTLAPALASASRPWRTAPAAAAGVDHEERAVQERAQDGRVGDRLERRAVEDDQIAAGLEAVQDRPHPLRAEQLGRVGRQRARGEDPQVLLLGRLGDRVQAHLVAPQQRREAVRVGQVEDEVDARLPQVRVHQEDPAAGLGEHDGQVGRRDGLALARDRARHEEGPDRRVDRRELDVGPERPVGLRDAGARVEEGGEPVDLAAGPVALHARDRAEGAQPSDLLDLVGILDRIVEILRNGHDSRGDQQAEDCRQERVQQRSRRDRRGGAPRPARRR